MPIRFISRGPRPGIYIVVFNISLNSFPHSWPPIILIYKFKNGFAARVPHRRRVMVLANNFYP